MALRRKLEGILQPEKNLNEVKYQVDPFVNSIDNGMVIFTQNNQHIVVLSYEQIKEIYNLINPEKVFNAEGQLVKPEYAIQTPEEKEAMYQRFPELKKAV